MEAHTTLETTHSNAPARNTITSLLAAALIVGTGAFSATAAERLIRTPDGDVVRLDAPNTMQQSLKGVANRSHPFATAEQRAAASPMIWNESSLREKTVGSKPGLDPRARGPATETTGGASPPFAEYIARGDFPDEWREIDRQESTPRALIDGNDEMMTPSDGAHYSYVRYPGNLYTSQWKAAPWNKIGKLYFTTPSGGSSYCTANVASGNSVVITAAHCVYTRGQGFNSNFVFVPADRYGVAPYGKYGWQSATVLNNWITNGGRRWDVAVIKLAGEQSSGRPVTDYVGWLGRSWNQPYTAYTYSHGYASNLSTQYTNICRGNTYSSSNEGTDVVVQGCDMTYGSSGGGWLRNYTPNSHAGNHVNAVVSGPHIGDFGQSYVGPRFSSSNIVPLCNAIGC